MEDKTKVLSDEEQANDGSDKAPTTQPMLKQILEEMRGGFAEVNAKIDALTFDVKKIKRNQRELKGRVDELEGRIAS
jgi:hypothetical protein